MTIKDALRHFPICEMTAKEAIHGVDVYIPHTVEVLYTLAKAYYELMHEEKKEDEA